MVCPKILSACALLNGWHFFFKTFSVYSKPKDVFKVSTDDHFNSYYVELLES